MKIKFQYIGLLALILAATSCKKDNFEAPSSTLTGKIHYQGEAIQVEYNRVPFELYQFGFGKIGSIAGTFTQEGTYSMVLFDGQYKFIVPNDQGPFLWNRTAGGAPDSLDITVAGSQALDIEVTPYYMIRTPQLTAASGKVTGTFKIEKIVVNASAREVENVTLYINKTQFVSEGDNNVARASMNAADITDPNNVTMELAIPNIVPTQSYVFARIGLKIEGVEDRIYSPVVKLTY